MLGAVFGTLWSVALFPFRLLFWLVEWLGRLTALVLGFALMVIGVAFWVSPMALVGVPLFVVGLLLTVRSLDR